MTAEVLDFRPLILGTMSFPDLWTALQEADREERRLDNRLDACRWPSQDYARVDAQKDAVGERIGLIEGEIRKRLSAALGGVSIHDVAERL